MTRIQTRTRPTLRNRLVARRTLLARRAPIGAAAGLAAATLIGAGPLAGSAHAVDIAGTSFEEPSTAAQTTDNTNFGSAAGLTYTSTGGELGFTTSFTDTRSTGESGPVVGSESGDFIGVTNFTGDVGSFTDGTKGYQWNDTDGAVTLSLDSVDTTGFTSLNLNFDLFTANTGFESTDSFDVSVNSTSVLNLDDSALESPTYSGVWKSESLDISSFDGQTIDVAFTGDTNSVAENFYLDNVVITGTAATGGDNGSEITTSPGSLDFGTFLVGASLADQNASIDENNGVATDFAATASGAATVSPTTGSIAASGTETLAVNVNPANGQSISETVTVSNTGDSTDPDDVINVTGTALDPANASFDGSSDSDFFEINFGAVLQNSTAPSQTFSISNLLATSGFTADLDLDSFTTSTDIPEISTDLATFTDLAAGDSQSFNATMSTSNLGSFEEVIDLTASSAGALPGDANESLQLTITGDVVSELPGEDLLITTVADGTNSGGNPKLVEIVAINDIADLSTYALARNTNGDGNGLDDFSTLPSVSLDAGEFFYIVGNSDSETFLNNLGITDVVIDGIANINGDDILGLAFDASQTIFDLFGQESQGDTNFYQDSIAARLASSVFPDADGSLDAQDNFDILAYSDSTLSSTLGTFVVPEPASVALLAAGAVLLGGRRRRQRA